MAGLDLGLFGDFDSFGDFDTFLVNFVFVDSEEFFVFHDYLTVYDNGFYFRAVGTVAKCTDEVVFGYKFGDV